MFSGLQGQKWFRHLVLLVYYHTAFKANIKVWHELLPRNTVWVKVSQWPACGSATLIMTVSSQLVLLV